MSPRAARIAELRRGRERSRLLSWSMGLMSLFVAGSWLLGGFEAEGILAPRRIANLQRFLGELRPHPLQGRDWDWSIALDWAGTLMRAKGMETLLVTLGISVAAIALAALFGGLLALPAAREFASAEPLLPALRPPGRLERGGWRGLTLLVRGLLVFCRAIPEYVWAFLLLALLGPSAWPAVLALAIHNTGILGRLGAEVVENLDRAPLAALRSLGPAAYSWPSPGCFRSASRASCSTSSTGGRPASGRPRCWACWASSPWATGSAMPGPATTTTRCSFSSCSAPCWCCWGTSSRAW